MPKPTLAPPCYALAARQSARHLSRLYDSHLAPAGLTVSQFSILMLIEGIGALKIAALADIMVMERTTLLRALKPLQTAGWIVIAKLENVRSFDLQLSRSGQDKLAEARPLWRAAQAAFEREVGRHRAIRFRDEILGLNLGN